MDCVDQWGGVGGIGYGQCCWASKRSSSLRRSWRRRVAPYSTWLSSGDNAWQMTAATLVGLMSIPALAVLYGGIVPRKWAINTTMMVFCTFAFTLLVWGLWALKMGVCSACICTFIRK